jgi:hypothetical protein
MSVSPKLIPQPQAPSTVATDLQSEERQSIMKRAMDLWPYALLIGSVTGLLYIAVNAAR